MKTALVHTQEFCVLKGHLFIIEYLSKIENSVRLLGLVIIGTNPVKIAPKVDPNFDNQIMSLNFILDKNLDKSYFVTKGK